MQKFINYIIKGKEKREEMVIFGLRINRAAIIRRKSPSALAPLQEKPL